MNADVLSWLVTVITGLGGGVIRGVFTGACVIVTELEKGQKDLRQEASKPAQGWTPADERHSLNQASPSTRGPMQVDKK